MTPAGAGAETKVYCPLRPGSAGSLLAVFSFLPGPLSPDGLSVERVLSPTETRSVLSAFWGLPAALSHPPVSSGLPQDSESLPLRRRRRKAAPGWWLSPSLLATCQSCPLQLRLTTVRMSAQKGPLSARKYPRFSSAQPIFIPPRPTRPSAPLGPLICLGIDVPCSGLLSKPL